MKPKLFCLIAIIPIFLWLLPGCSMFVSAPRFARIQIKGLGNQYNEFVFTLDDVPKEDIQINDRYAIELDLQWLWYEQEDLIFIKRDVDDNQDEFLPLTPWFICKYRF